MWNCIQHQLDGKSDISLSAGNTGLISHLKNDFKND